jgi:hypothetical protein
MKQTIKASFFYLFHILLCLVGILILLMSPDPQSVDLSDIDDFLESAEKLSATRVYYPSFKFPEDPALIYHADPFTD